MQNRYRSQIALLTAVVFVIGLCFVDAGAQRRKRRKSRARNTTAASPSPTPGSDSADPRIVSTAGDQNAADAVQPNDKLKNRQANNPRPSDPDEMRQTIIGLSNQVTKLSEKLTQMEEQQRALVDMERLTRAEQRAENLSAQLRDVQAKEADLQTQLDQVEFALQPENIERVVGSFGTTHPEEARDQRRRQLEGQRTRIHTQLAQLAQGRVRLEAAITSADGEVELLRKRVETLNKTTEPAAGAPIARPTPTPIPPVQ